MNPAQVVKENPNVARHYVRGMEQKTGRKIPGHQRQELAADVRENIYTKLSSQDQAAHRNAYRREYNRMIAAQPNYVI